MSHFLVLFLGKASKKDTNEAKTVLENAGFTVKEKEDSVGPVLEAEGEADPTVELANRILDNAPLFI